MGTPKQPTDCIFHDVNGEWTAVEDWKTFTFGFVFLAIDIALIWGVWHFCKVKRWL
jgi:hypothetical protein